MNILFLSRMVPEEYKEEVYKKQKGAMQSAAISFQEKLIHGLETNLGHPVHLFNLMPVYSFPKHYKDYIVKPNRFSHAKGSKDYNVGFYNLMIIKQLLLPVFYMCQFRRNLKDKTYDAVICYTPNVVLLKAVKWMKIRYPHIKNCVVVPDMPEFIDLSENPSVLKRAYNRWLSRRSRKMTKYIDSFVYLTAQSAEFFCDDKPYVVVEGIADDTEDEKSQKIFSDKKVILYTGTTNSRFGIMNLLDAFSQISDENYELWICGCGDSDDRIKEAVKSDSRIKFKGIVPHEKVISLQRQATVLVNPRPNEGEYTKYSFPSKNMEYLSTGIPLVAFKLDGIPEEYDPYCIYVKENTTICLAQTLEMVCEWDEKQRKEFGQKAKAFIQRYKNAKLQTRKIIKMLEELR